MLAGAAQAQSTQTLADIRQDISVMQVEIARLKQELNTTGSGNTLTGGSALDRVNAIETALQRMTAKTEGLELRINRIVKDGTNRLGDLEFRVCEVEPGCDIGTLGQTAPIGGEEVASIAPVDPIPSGSDALPVEGELAISEEADFRAAQDALNAQDFAGAAQLFALFRENYPQGPLEAASLLGEGRALDGQGDTREAARRYLQAYSGYPDAKVAPEALWRLGTSLAALGSTPEACVTLAEVSGRYPASEFVIKAASSMADLSCQ